VNQNTKKILVTGGCGYIGSHVARAFKNEGHTVHINDRVQRNHTLQSCDLWWLDDFSSTASLAGIVRENYDVIVHCAGTSLVGPSVLSPDEYWDNNVAKLIKLLDTLKQANQKPLMMFSGSAAVYGEPIELPIPETHPQNSISPYGNTKATAEHILEDYANAYGIPAMVFRFFNACGAEPFNYDLGQEPNATHIVGRVLESALSDSEFTINGDDFDTEDGTCVRDYIHVWDIARAHVMGAEKHWSSDVGFQVMNLGTRTGISNKEIANYVKTKYNFNKISYGPRRAGDPGKLIADPTLANTWLGWQPEYSSIETIIDSAYKWYTQQWKEHTHQAQQTA
jgi:UDP-glucose 4-epimerase